MARSERTGPLNGYRIVEFGANLTAPVAAMLLGDQGAEVIKVEPPSGDQARYAGAHRRGVPSLGTVFLNANRSKRSIMLDLKRHEDRVTALEISASCDVLIQNYRPGVMKRLGLDYQSVRAIRPDIIYLSIDGLGQVGPGAGRRVYDIVVQGLAGFAALQRDRITGEPQTINNALIDKITGLAAWQAATAALLHRERTGFGQEIHVSMLDVALAFLWPDGASNATLLGGDVDGGATMASQRYVYPTSDGHILVAAVSDGEWESLCRALERPELGTDPRFGSMQSRAANTAAITSLLAETLATRTSAEWLLRLEREDAVFAPVNEIGSLHSDPQIVARGSLADLHHPLAGPYRQPAHPIVFGACVLGANTPAPALDEHGDAIRRELGRDATGD